MEKMNNNKIITFSLGILSILILGIIAIPSKVDASYNYTWNSGNDFSNSNYPNYPTYNQTPTPVYVQEPVYIQEPIYVTQPVTTTPATPTVYSNATNPNATKTVAKAKTTNTTTSVATVKTSDTKNLTANAFWGSDSFMPSSIAQWLLFIILVLLSVVLVRKIYGGNEKYQAIPLKHN